MIIPYDCAHCAVLLPSERLRHQLSGLPGFNPENHPLIHCAIEVVMDQFCTIKN